VVSRSHGIKPWPNHSVGGPMVALCNEYSGSDGDIFTHSWKELGLGPVVGTRTWGGVIGISPRRPLVDRAITTQPEFAYWFANGTGYDVENQGVMPDIEVVVPPHAQGDPQLDRALEVLVERLDAAPPPVTPRA
jgi:tricorn protease